MSLNNKEITELIESQTVAQNFLDQSLRSPDSVALKWKVSDGWDQLTYKELSVSVAKVCTALTEKGLNTGDQIVLMMKNRSEFHILDLAALFLGVTPVSIYNTSAAEQVSNILKTTEAKMGFVEDSFSECFMAAESNNSDFLCCTIGGSENADFVFSDLLDSEPADLQKLASATKDDALATLIFTSGTTGEPKGVMLDNKNISWTVACLRNVLKLDHYVGVRLISYLPMAHIAERMVSHYVSLLSGFEVICCPDPTLVADYARDVKPNILFGVPRVYEKVFTKVNAILNPDQNATGFAKFKGNLVAKLKVKFFSKKIQEKIGLDELIIAVSGGAPLAPEIMEWFHSIKVPLSEIYGLSETSGPLTWDPFEVKVGSAGRPCVGTELKLASDGEILCRGGNIFRGYFADPGKTAEVLDPDGWLSTGDIGEIDDQGYLKVVDRKKEIIVTSGGKNISPCALENSLKLISLVDQAIAVGDDKKFVSALVTLDTPAVESWLDSKNIKYESETDFSVNDLVVAEVNRELKEVMQPYSSAESVRKMIVLSDAWLPDSDVLTATSKLKRRVIHKKYSAEIDSIYK